MSHVIQRLYDCSNINIYTNIEMINIKHFGEVEIGNMNRIILIRKTLKSGRLVERRKVRRLD